MESATHVLNPYTSSNLVYENKFTKKKHKKRYGFEMITNDQDVDKLLEQETGLTFNKWKKVLEDFNNKLLLI